MSHSKQGSFLVWNFFGQELELGSEWGLGRTMPETVLSGRTEAYEWPSFWGLRQTHSRTWESHFNPASQGLSAWSVQQPNFCLALITKNILPLSSLLNIYPVPSSVCLFISLEPYHAPWNPLCTDEDPAPGLSEPVLSSLLLYGHFVYFWQTSLVWQLNQE